MKLLGLNSPEIFVILTVLLTILGTKRIEKGFILFKKLLKFLLSKDEDQSSANSKVKPEEPGESKVKEETVEAEVKPEEPGESEVKEETVEAEVKSEEAEESEVKEETVEKGVKSTKSKKRTFKDEIKDAEVDSDN